ncbi:hypothetical protein ACR42A_19005 [Burkholderia gladioli]|nr:hypothetical protein [Burkholderia gladioli]MDN7599112.1 hypothetical protein [Burkholderia gladioli]
MIEQRLRAIARGRIETMAACRVAARSAAIRKVELVDEIEIERRLFHHY